MHDSPSTQSASSSVPAAKGWLHPRPGEHCFIHVGAEDTGGLYSVVEIVSNPGDGTPLHVHEREDEHIFVVEGTVRVASGDKVFDAHAGDMVTLRKGIPHAWGNRSDADLRLVFVIAPGGCEAFFRLDPRDMPDAQSLIERFHIPVVGPAPF